MDLAKLVTDRISELGTKEAAKFFGVSVGTISNWASGKTQPTVSAVQQVFPENPPAPKPSVEAIELPMWDGRKVMVLLPVYRTFNASTHWTLFANYAKYGAEKIAMEMVNRTVIHEARNILADRFMKSQAERCIMVDDDMILPYGNAASFVTRYGQLLTDKQAAVHTFGRLLSSGEDKGIVGALYFGRSATGKAQCDLGMGNNNQSEKFRRGEMGAGLLKMGWVATGCIKIERWVLEKMKAEIDNGRWPECKPQHEDSWYGYFNPLRVRVGEDVSFGRRAEEIGIQSYLDAGCVCLHVGETMFGPTNTKSP